MIETIEQIITSIEHSWQNIVDDCRLVLGSELHYQAMIYYNLRLYGKIPINQIGMNVKIRIDKPKSKLFIDKDKSKHPDFQGHFEPIPDIAIFKTQINSDWRRRNYKNTFKNLLYAIEIKASERENKRLSYKEITDDIDKLNALQFECKSKKNDIGVAIIIIDTAILPDEQMTKDTIEELVIYSKSKNVSFLYLSQENQQKIFEI